MPGNADLRAEMDTLRSRVLGALEALKTEHEWVTTEMLQKVIMMQHGVNYSLSRVGNNLRCLRGHGVVEDQNMRGVRHWRLTGNVYAPDAPVKLLVSFPSAVHSMIADFSKRGGISKNAFVVNMVASGIQQLTAAKLGSRKAVPPFSEATPS